MLFGAFAGGTGLSCLLQLGDGLMRTPRGMCWMQHVCQGILHVLVRGCNCVMRESAGFQPQSVTSLLTVVNKLRRTSSCRAVLGRAGATTEMKSTSIAHLS